MPSSVEVQGLCKEYSGKQVLSNVSFRVERGEIFVLVGPNGAGKTTLLRILDFLEEPTSGKILFDGEPTDYSENAMTTLRRRMSLVFQKTVLFNMSVFDNVAYGLKVRGENGADMERKAKAALELVKLRGLGTKNALALSGGEAQRVALAQALVTEPELLLLDEPTANLDPKSVSIIEEALSNVNQEKKITIIMATHNMLQAKNLAHKVAALNEGRIDRVGTFQEVFETPSRFLADFARLENVFSGVSKVTGEGTSLVDVGEGLQIEAAFEKAGQVTLFVRPEDIILSSNPIVSSARNSFEGRIVEVSDLGKIVKLRVRAGRDFMVQITKRSFNDMELNIDSKVFLAFKASSVQMV